MIFTTDDNTLTAYGSIWDGDGMRFIQHLKDLESKDGEITLKLHTPGGSVFDGNLIYNAIKDSKADIRIEIIGVAASMGAIISLSREKVYMAENGFLMIHAPSGMSWGNALEHEHTGKLLRSMEKNFTKKLTAKTGHPTSYVKKWLNGDNWFDAEQAEEEGLIAGIIEPEADVDQFDPHGMNRDEIYGRFAAALMPPKITPQPKHEPKPNNSSDMKSIISHFGLNENADEKDVLSAIAKTESELATAKKDLGTVQDKYNALKKEADEKKSAELTSALDKAVSDGRIDKSAEEAIKAMPHDNAMALLEALPKRKTINDRIDNEGKNKYAEKTWEELDKEGLLAEMKEKDPDYFAERFEAQFGRKPSK